MSAGTVQNFLTVLHSKIVQYDQAVSAREAKRGRVNIYRLGLLLEAAQRVDAEVAGELHRSDPAALEHLVIAMDREFTPGFPPVKATIKQIDQFLKSGKGPSIVRKNPTDLAIREKYERCVSHVTRRGQARDPKTVCAAAMRSAYGAQFQRISAEGRSLAAARRHARGMVLSRRTGRLSRRPRAKLRPTAIERRGLMGRVSRQQWTARHQKRLHGRRLNPVLGVDGPHYSVHDYQTGSVLSGRATRDLIMHSMDVSDGVVPAYKRGGVWRYVAPAKAYTKRAQTVYVLIW